MATLPKFYTPNCLNTIQEFIAARSEGHQYVVSGYDSVSKKRFTHTLFKVKAIPFGFCGSDFYAYHNEHIIMWETINKITCKDWNSDKKVEENKVVYDKKISK